MRSDAFRDHLHTLACKTFFLSAAPGNSGDLLLQKGLEQYLLTHNFNVVDRAQEADVVMVHGGANINDIWHVGIPHLAQVLEEYPQKTIIVAPHTYCFKKTDFAQLFAHTTQPIHLFARERYSYERLRALVLPHNVSVGLADDTAFLLDGTRYIAQLKLECTDTYPLYAMRTDRESAFIPFYLDDIPQNMYESIKLKMINYFLRQVIRKEQCSADPPKDLILQDVSYLPYRAFVKKIQHASEIHTDRLHVGILGALLGKHVYLYRTKYDKVVGVYEQSLYRYKNVTTIFN